MYFELNRHPAQVPRTKIEFCPPPQYWAGELCSGLLGVRYIASGPKKVLQGDFLGHFL